MTEDSYLMFALNLILEKSLGQKYSLEQILPRHDIPIYIWNIWMSEMCTTIE